MKPRRKKVQTTVFLEPEQVERLDLHRQSGRPTAVLIREGIDLVLAKYGPQNEPPNKR